ncbi:hypothetical protein [Enterovibrio paralichthyis]|uniref:hypothetical protein n=1 Tax=Enterovibrio paralichthyis TaxID=2853805 RepID=UPI001C48405C|nr:hypothetical protein [Enterovibrio paralichthyis]MBV7300247.1 hypothetical protein [Enterovibrio paralichthyis]
MPSIRYRHNYKATILTSSGFVPGSRPITGDSIPALLKDGSTVFFNFGGFIDNNHIGHYQKVKLVRIEAYTPDEYGLSGWQDIDSNRVVGIFKNGQYLVVLQNGKPIAIE